MADMPNKPAPKPDACSGKKEGDKCGGEGKQCGGMK